AKTWTCQPAKRISASSDSRTETSSSTTNTIGVACSMEDDPLARSVAPLSTPPAGHVSRYLSATQEGRICQTPESDPSPLPHVSAAQLDCHTTFVGGMAGTSSRRRSMLPAQEPERLRRVGRVEFAQYPAGRRFSHSATAVHDALVSVSGTSAEVAWDAPS